MSDNTAKPEATTASDDARDAPPTSSGQKDVKTMFEEAWEHAEEMTEEEMLKKHPWMKNIPPRPLDYTTALEIMEEMEREEAAAWDDDEKAENDPPTPVDTARALEIQEEMARKENPIGGKDKKTGAGNASGSSGYYF